MCYCYYVLYVLSLLSLHLTSVCRAQCSSSEVSSIQTCGVKIKSYLAKIQSGWPIPSPLPEINNAVVYELCTEYRNYLSCVSPTYLTCGKHLKEVTDTITLAGLICVDQKAVFSTQSDCVEKFLTYPNSALSKCIRFAKEIKTQTNLLASAMDRCKAYNEVTDCVIPLVQAHCGEELGDALKELYRGLLKTFNDCELTADNVSIKRSKRAVSLDLKADFHCDSPFLAIGQECYYANINKVTEPQSEDACKAINSKSLLGSIHSEDERTIVQNLMLQNGITDLWIGARHVNSTWFWLDGSQFNFYAWGKDQPNLALRCVVQSASINYRWKSADCYPPPNVNSYFCKMSPPITCDLAVNPCLNGGTCVTNGAKGSCICQSPFTGTFCSSFISCTPNPCQNGGQCVSTNNINSCSCPINYNGSFCETFELACDSNPCQNNGRCSLSNGGYKCACRNGITGTNCEINIDECSSNPCLNGGTCIDGLNGYNCSCRTGYSGNVCQTSTAGSCLNNPCLNGGTCQAVGNSFSCLCPTGFSGTVCQSAINYCVPTPCLNGGTCSSTNSGYTCSCPVGYTGSRCQTLINNCASTPCLNNGTCLNSRGGYTCQCMNGYSGTNCQTSACMPNPCQNNGQCVTTSTGFYCNCTAGFTGTLCMEATSSVCLSNPCQNSGTCTELSSTQYRCQCSSGWNGANCNVDTNECLLSPSPCQNGATCTNTPGSYYCTCATGFSGSNCAISSNGPCVSNPCANGGTCSVPTGTSDYMCTCATGFMGPTCAFRLCQINWTYYDNYCYTVSSNPVAQTNAKTACLNEGSTLSSIRNSNERDFVAGLMTSNNVNQAWIGAEYNGNGYSWPDQTAWSYSSWTSGQPSSQSTMSCVSQSVSSGVIWQTENCNTVLASVCKSNAKIYTTSVSPCASNPCLNGGTCSTVGSTYVCSCASGYGGTNCQSTATICTSDTCANGGTCKVINSNPVCVCKQNYTVNSNCQLPCPPGWIWFIGRCYLVNNNAVNFQTAFDSCPTKQVGSHLFYTESQDEFYFACTLANKMASNIWIGLRNDQSTGKFLWSHGKYLGFNDYKAWGYNQPRNQNVAKCVQSVSLQGCTWETSSCDNFLKYVCKWDGSS